MPKGNAVLGNLTKEQSACVNFDSGDLLIKGVAGSGKSYVVLRRALKLSESKAAEETIAIFTYTNSLVKYTDDLIVDKIGPGRLKVDTIDRYCMSVYANMYGKRFHVSENDGTQLIDDAIQRHKKQTGKNHRLYDIDTSFYKDEFLWIKEKCIRTKGEYLSASRKGRGSQIRLSSDDRRMVWAIYAIYMDRAKECHHNSWPDLYIALSDNLEHIPEDMKFDYVLLDEAQDMTVGKLKVIKALTRKSLTIAADMAQKIYKTSFTWKEVGIDISGRSSKTLSKSFRSTKQIIELAEDLMAVNRAQDKGNNEYTEAKIPEREGPKPRLVKFGSKMAETRYLIDLLQGYPAGDEAIGVICRTNKDIDEMKRLLYRAGLSYEVVDNKKKEYARWSLLKPGIKLVKAHSSKGLEFERVIIPNLNDDMYPFLSFKTDDDDLEEYLRIERSLLYVAMTRARSTLVMLCVDASRSRFIDEFKEEHMDVESI